MIWHMVMRYARKTGLVDKLGPQDLSRTCAKLCRAAGGELEQIQFLLLGHASIQTAERYLGSRQNLKEAVNDRLRVDLLDSGKHPGVKALPEMFGCVLPVIEVLRFLLSDKNRIVNSLLRANVIT